MGSSKWSKMDSALVSLRFTDYAAIVAEAPRRVKLILRKPFRSMDTLRFYGSLTHLWQSNSEKRCLRWAILRA
jgi:hypothetical protein